MKMQFLIIFMFFMGLFSFVMNRKHMLMLLLSSEFIILSLLLLMFMYFLNSSNEYFLVFFLSFSVCESVLFSHYKGLLLLVSLFCSHSSGYFN